MNKIFTLIIIFASFSCCFSQNNENKSNEDFRRGYVAITAGPAFPIGQFGRNEISNDKAGFAKTGLNIGIVNIAYRFKKIELAGLLMGSSHFLSLNTNNTDASWVYSGIFLGPVIPIDISKKLQTGIKVMLGYVAVVSPEIRIASLIQNSQMGNSLSITTGVNVRYNFSSKWCSIIDVYYLAIDPKFTNFEQRMRLINGNIGIGFRLR